MLKGFPTKDGMDFKCTSGLGVDFNNISYINHDF